MTVVFGLGVGLAAYRQSWENWHEALLAAAVCWVVIGLAKQAADLAAVLRNGRELVAAQRRGGRFAIAWRLATIGLLIGYPTIEVMRREGILALSKPERALYDVGETIREVLFYLAIVLSLSGVRRLAASARPPSLRRQLIDALGWIAGAILVLLATSNDTFVAYLVHIAIRGIEGSFPVRFAILDVEPNLAIRDQRFALASMMAACIVLWNLLLVRRLTLGIPNARTRCISLLCLLAGLAACAGHDFWLYAAGIYQFSSWLPEASVAVPWHWYAAALLLLAIASGAATYDGLLKRPNVAFDFPRLECRAQRGAYFHERRLAPLVLVVAIGWPIGQSILQTSHFGWVDAIGGWLAWPTNYAILAALSAALTAIFGGWSNSSSAVDLCQIALPGRFGLCWLAMFVTFVLALPAAFWCNFSLWATFAHRIPWP